MNLYIVLKSRSSVVIFMSSTKNWWQREGEDTVGFRPFSCSCPARGVSGLQPTPLASEAGVLTAGPPGSPHGVPWWWCEWKAFRGPNSTADHCSPFINSFQCVRKLFLALMMFYFRYCILDSSCFPYIHVCMCVLRCCVVSGSLPPHGR